MGKVVIAVIIIILIVLLLLAVGTGIYLFSAGTPESEDTVSYLPSPPLPLNAFDKPHTKINADLNKCNQVAKATNSNRFIHDRADNSCYIFPKNVSLSSAEINNVMTGTMTLHSPF